MARHENEDTSSLDIPDGYKTDIRFLGEKKCEADADTALAKEVTTWYNLEKHSTQYFIRVGRGEIIDPYGADYGYTKSKLSSMYKFKKVSKEAFEIYEHYLGNKNRLYFTKARRLVME